MPPAKSGRGRKRRQVPNVSQRAGGSATASRSPLPSQYNFTPAALIPPPQSTSPQVPSLANPSTSRIHVGSYPPPQQLFQNSMHQQSEAGVTPSSQEFQNNEASTSADLQDAPASPRYNSQDHSRPSSQGNNFHEESEVLPDLQGDMLRALNALLMVPDRDKFTTVLSPTPLPNTTWFTRDKGSKLLRSITKIFTNKFDDAYYSWTCVPRERQERYFFEFAKTHTWDPLITGTVQQHFEEICQRRMKDMVSNVRNSREQPTWIGNTLWKTMCAYWDTDEARQRSHTYSKSRMSDRKGLGPHVHLAGPKSYQQIQQEMEETLGREVSLGEVFIKTHTKPDGSYVDRKAEKIAQTYEQKVQEKLSELGTGTSDISDGASRPRELTVDDYTSIFLQATVKDSRGNHYGVGSLKGILVGGKRKQPEDCSSFVGLQQQLKEAQRKIEEQATYNERIEAEHSRTVAEQKEKLEHLSLVEKYLRQTDPHFLDFISTHSSASSTEPPNHPQPDPTTRPTS